MRLARRYICAAVVVTSLFWLTIDIIGIMVAKRSQTSKEQPVSITRRFRSSELVTIDYFKKYYKSVLNPEPGGAGMDGAAVANSAAEKVAEDKSLLDYGFNELSSSKISLERTVPDNRNDACSKVKYPKNLPTASVIVIFHNEAWSTLLRTVHTVLARSPPHMLHEIILVDDASVKNDIYSHLGKALDDYVKKLPKVRLIRSPIRVGLTQARLIGAGHSKGDVVVFLDSHCEATDGWLEPMLARLLENRKLAVVPDIEVIAWKDFEYSRDSGSYNRGIFSWELMFNWGPLPEREVKRRKADSDPIKSPTMAGGLFAMERKYFFESGAYDRQLTYWGGENVEMSFRLWMCGEGIEILPCSRVGHVFRERAPYKSPDGSTDHNSIRVAEVWMDEFKEIFYSFRANLRPEMGGNVEERRKLRDKLQCKSFKWYLENVIPELEMPDRYPLGRGDVRNLGTNSCLDTLAQNNQGGKPGLYPCHKMGTNQFFILTTKNEVWHDSLCLDLDSDSEKAKSKLWPCHKHGGNQKWIHTQKDGLIKHAYHERCLEGRGDQILIRSCNRDNRHQIWVFESYPADHIPANAKKTWL